MKNIQRYISFIVLVTYLLSGCTALDWINPPATEIPAASSGEPQAMTTFRLTLPDPLLAGSSVFLVFLDETTGLPFNQQKVAMTLEDDRHLVAIVPLPVGSLVKYRYARQGEYLAQEYTPDGRPVRYRLHLVDGPEKVEDILTRWVDSIYTGPTGRILGHLVDAKSKQPLSDLLVFAGGMQTMSAEDGSFQFEGLPPGIQNLVVFAPNGGYRTFKQGALVAPDSATPAEITLQSLPMVKVVFVVQIPGDTPAGALVRLAGSLSQLGATFSEQRGEISVLAAKMPVLQALPDGRYTATVDLPAGMQFTYRYTLGDGLWNSEHTTTGGFGQRRLTVPSKPEIIADSVYTWGFGDPGAITFAVRVPAQTPANEQISIQFNPGYGWTEPIPLWPAGSNQWFFTLYSPLIGLTDLQYRYCRVLDCGSADEAAVSGTLAQGHTVKILKTPQAVSDQVDAWAMYNGPQRLAVVPAESVNPRSDGFAAGIAFQSSGYTPSWDVNFPEAVYEAAQINANWLYLTPTWSVLRSTPPIFEPVAGHDMSAGLIGQTINNAHSNNLKVGLFPSLRYPLSSDQWWIDSRRDFAWWVSWFGNYRRFILNFAQLAEEQKAGSLILGGPEISPALPDGMLSNGTASGVMADANIRWTEIISDVRKVYSGPIYWALAYPAQVEKLPSFVEKVDGFYILWSVKLADEPSLDLPSLTARAGTELDTSLLPVATVFQKPILLAVSYPSAHGALMGCVIRQEGTCASFAELARPLPDMQGVALDLEEQEAAYNAMLQAVNQRPWIGGFVSQGYYVPVPLQDKSLSVRGKPASGVLWFWFAKFLNK